MHDTDYCAILILSREHFFFNVKGFFLSKKPKAENTIYQKKPKAENTNHSNFQGDYRKFVSTAKQSLTSWLASYQRHHRMTFNDTKSVFVPVSGLEIAQRGSTHLSIEEKDSTSKYSEFYFSKH